MTPIEHGPGADVKSPDGFVYDTREWRVADYHPSLVVAVNPTGDDQEIAVLLGEGREERAEQIVREHAMLSAPYADDQHRGGHWLAVLPQRPRWAETT